MSLKVTRKSLVVYITVMLTILSCTLPFNMFGGEPEVPPTEPAVAIVAVTDVPPTPTETTAPSATPTFTATPEPTPTITATPDPILLLPDYVQEALQWQLSFFEDFADNSQEWFLGEFSRDEWTSLRDISAGSYYWTVEIIEEREIANPLYTFVPNFSAALADVFFSAKLQLVDGPEQSYYGIAFRSGVAGRYSFVIRDGAYQLIFDDRDSIATIIDWTPSEAIEPGQMNELAVSANGANISLFINQEMVADITDTRSPDGSIFLALGLNDPGEGATLAVDEVLLQTRADTLFQEAMQWPLVFQEKFVNNDNGWTIGSVTNDFYDGEFVIADGKYMIEASSKQGFYHNHYPETLDVLTDFYLTVDVNLLEGSENLAYGLGFRITGNDYYMVTDTISDFVLLKPRLYYQNEWFEFWGYLYSYAALGLNEGDVVRLGLIASGDNFIVLCNDLILFEFVDSRVPAGQAGIVIGLIEGGESGAWEFSNFNIYSPTGEPMTQIPAEPTPTADAEPAATPTVGVQTGLSEAVNPKDGANLVFVPAGEFLMGYAGGEDDEQPEHLVYLDDYWLYQTPVTNTQYRQCIIDGGCDATLSRFAEDALPVVRINWDQAVDYCEWAGGRLPTEAEWEKGARGTDGRLYPWGNQAPTCLLSSYLGCFPNELTPVGQLPDGASPYGALDMLGLVWEWVSDWYDSRYYTNSPSENPTGPALGTFRVQRGHSFESNQIYLRITDRASSNPFSTDYRKGFRCVLTELP